MSSLWKCAIDLTSLLHLSIMSEFCNALKSQFIRFSTLNLESKRQCNP